MATGRGGECAPLRDMTLPLFGTPARATAGERLFPRTPHVRDRLHVAYAINPGALAMREGDGAAGRGREREKGATPHQARGELE